MTANIPLCVDLDGTLVQTDTLIESFAKDVINNPVQALIRTRQLTIGKAQFKDSVSSHTSLDVTTLPYNKELVEYIREEKKKRKIVLITGANIRIATAVSNHLNLFDEVYASDSETNLTNTNKQALLEQKFGQGGYDYVGNDKDDEPVWASARHALVVSAEGNFLKTVRDKFQPARVFVTPAAGIREWIKFARVHQWTKNLLIFVPFFLDHRFFQPADALIVFIAFLAMSLLASATYMVNDFLDVESDRSNTTKSTRALASGVISIPQALFAAFILLCGVFILCLFLPPLVISMLAIYLCTTLLYSLLLKQIVILDICAIAALHTLRIIAGTLVISASWSFWLLAFSMFFFMSLALAKRVSELENIKAEKKANPTARDYKITDIHMLSSAGISSGFISILVIALYINSVDVRDSYDVPEVLWLICPFLLYWVARLWIITTRGQMHEDPIIFALKDKASLVVLICISAVFAAAVLIH